MQPPADVSRETIFNKNEIFLWHRCRVYATNTEIFLEDYNNVILNNLMPGLAQVTI
jgi:hypothetical protein